MVATAPRTPNGIVQPPRARHKNGVKKRTILRAQRSAGTACSALRSPSLGLPAACADHTCIVPRRHDGRSVGTTPHRDHARHNGPRSEPRSHTITLPDPNGPHRTTRRSYHTRHHGHLHDGAGTTGIPESRPTRHHQKGVPTTRPGRRTDCPSAAASAPQKLSKSQRSRARSGRLHGGLGGCRSVGAGTGYYPTGRSIANVQVAPPVLRHSISSICTTAPRVAHCTASSSMPCVR